MKELLKKAALHPPADLGAASTLQRRTKLKPPSAVISLCQCQTSNPGGTAHVEQVLFYKTGIFKCHHAKTCEFARDFRPATVDPSFLDMTAQRVS